MSEQIVAGQTTRAEVLKLLGAPDGRGHLDRWFAYGSLAGRGGVGWVALAGAPYGGDISKLGDWNRARRAIVNFTDDGVVSSIDFVEQNCTASHGNCLSVAGQDLITAEKKASQLERAGPVLIAQKEYTWVKGAGANCHLSAFAPRTQGSGELLIASRGILWSSAAQWNGATPAYVEIRYEDIESVRPVEKHDFNYWIPLKKRDGTCLLLHLGSYRLFGDSNPEPQEAARTFIVAHLVQEPLPAAQAPMATRPAASDLSPAEQQPRQEPPVSQ